jgi:hypothetical protein
MFSCATGGHCKKGCCRKKKIKEICQRNNSCVIKLENAVLKNRYQPTYVLSFSYFCLSLKKIFWQ